MFTCYLFPGLGAGSGTGDGQHGRGAAYGAALLAATGAGGYPSVEKACETAITVTGRTVPDAEQVKAYRQGYPVYRELYPALKASFGKLGAV